ncbi:FAD-dependent oxidoreductase [Myxococcus stipitatus]|uniref:FAD-dependent oxidoreductase n=1 Tax=Myxococcus stipitatus TaxID=83455 RepID=UPI0030D083DD
MSFENGGVPEVEADVVVVGAGAAGLMAALTASDAGARVVVVEKTDKLGGTAAVSGGVVWIPNNHHMPRVDISDSREEALAYVRRLADGRSEDGPLGAFIDTAPAMLRFLEARTSLRLQPLGVYPDYHPEFAGGRTGGRSLDPGLFDINRLNEWKNTLRRGPLHGSAALTVAEAAEWGAFTRPRELPVKLLTERARQGLVCYGAALAGGLLEALVQRGVELLPGVAGRELVADARRVVGLRAERAGRSVRLGARRGVILASGGFEWNKSLAARFLSGPLTHPLSPPANEGDGLMMAMALGADLGNMSEAWWCPALAIPGESYEGQPLSRADFSARCLPHSILVNRAGRRFANEAQNYNDLVKAFFTFDPVNYERPNLPAWLIVDQNFRDRYALGNLLPGAATPPWLAKADSLEELARRIEISPEGLVDTVRRFNPPALQGVDPCFHRGGSAYERFHGDRAHQPSPNLGPIERPPFHALQVFVGALGTKGGVRVDANARVLRVDGTPIDGLYAAGNVMASVMGAGYPGAGSTLGAAMTFGFIAARHAVGAQAHQGGAA